jgi:D-alanyl-D-alanine carboxypeptidase
MDKWLGAALDYIPRWLEHQMRISKQPGCVMAIAHNGKLVLERAYGFANLKRGVALTPRHRFRVASHSKSFTAAGILKLRERGRLQLDDPVGKHVSGLRTDVANATLSQLLSHSAGLIRDGYDSGQWVDRRPFLTEAEIRADLEKGLTIPANSRFKYSNHGFGLLGMTVAAVTGESYGRWIKREIVDAVGLKETLPDTPLPRGTLFARGHGSELPLGHRVIIPGENCTNDLAAATGFVSTAADLVRFFSQLAPEARPSVLSSASRREMTRRQWRDEHSSLERWYGLGTISGSIGDWGWFGHSGGFQGYITRTVVLPRQQLAISVLTNASDGWSHFWLDGMIHILRGYARNGAPSRRTVGWTGRWWSLWGAIDLVPMKDKVLVAAPVMFNPLMDASEIVVQGRDRRGAALGRIVLAGGFANHGEQVRLVRNARGKAMELQFSGSKMYPEAKIAAELRKKYE